MAKDIRMIVELNEGKHLRVRGQYAEYDSAAGVIKGFGEVICPKYKRRGIIKESGWKENNLFRGFLLCIKINMNFS